MIDLQKTIKHLDTQLSEIKDGINRNNICIEKLWSERQAPAIPKEPTEAQKKYWNRKKTTSQS